MSYEIKTSDPGYMCFSDILEEWMELRIEMKKKFLHDDVRDQALIRRKCKLEDEMNLRAPYTKN